MADNLVNKPAPDITPFIENQIPTPEKLQEYKPDVSLLSLADPTLNSTPEKQIFNILDSASKNMPSYASFENADKMNIVWSPIRPAHRYLQKGDRELGYDYRDPNLEDAYARKYWASNLFNNVIGFGTKFLGAAGMSLSSIPMLLGYIGQDNYVQKAIYGDNPLSDYINHWVRDVEESLPVYRTNAEDNHPVLKYFNIFDPVTFGNAYGGVINNLGFTFGALAGALIETAVITAATSGTGFFPALGKAAGTFVMNVSRLGRLVARTPTMLRGADVIFDVGRASTMTNRAVDLAQSTNYMRNTDEALSSYNKIKRALTTKEGIGKVRDQFTYNLGLLTSAHAEGLFEGGEVYERTYNELYSKFEEENGRPPSPEELSNIIKLADEARGRTVTSNIGLLYLTNRISFGALFKPTSSFIKGTVVKGWGRNIGVMGVKPTVGKHGRVAYETYKRTPDSILGKVLLNGKKLAIGLKRPIAEGFEEGSQYTISQTNIDYALKSYDLQSLGEVASYLNSFSKGFSDTLTTNEGWENIMAGFMGGKIGGYLTNRIVNRREGTKTREEHLKSQVKSLNENQFGELQYVINALSDPTYKTSGGTSEKIDNIVAGNTLAKEYKDAVEQGDIRRAKDIKDAMAISYWTSASLNGLIDARKEELEVLKGLEGDSFTDFWGLDYTTENVEKMNKSIDKHLERADIIHKNANLISNIKGKNPFNKKTQPNDYYAHETYIKNLIFDMSRIDLTKMRLSELRENLRENAPLLDLDKAIQLTSIQGMQTTSTEIQEEINRLNNLIETMSTESMETQVDIDIKFTAKDYKRRVEKLQKLKEDLDSLIENIKSKDLYKMSSNSFSGMKYLSTMRSLWSLREGVSIGTSKFLQDSYRFIPNEKLTENLDETMRKSPWSDELTDEQLAESLEKLQDIYSLASSLESFAKHYNYLSSAVGETEFKKTLREHEEKFLKSITNPDGTLKIPLVTDSEVSTLRDEEYSKIVPDDNVTTEEVESIKEAVKKPKSEWTAEEEQAVANNPSLFDAYKQAENNVQEAVSKKNLESLNNAFKNSFTPASTSVFSGVDTNTLLLALYYQSPTFMSEAEENLRKAIYNNSNSGRVVAGLGFSIEIRPNTIEYPSGITGKEKYLVRSAALKPNDRTLWTQEERDLDDKYPNLISTYRDLLTTLSENSIEKVAYRNIQGNLVETGLYRRKNIEVIKVTYNGNLIGELRPPDNLFYKNEKGEFIPLIDGTGKLTIDPTTYSKVTHNNITTYNQFKEELENYTSSYNKAFEKLRKNGNITIEEIKKLFKFTITSGSTEINSANKKNHDTDFNKIDLKYKSAVSIKKVVDIDGNIVGYEVVDIYNTNLTQDQLDSIKTLVASDEMKVVFDNIFRDKHDVLPFGVFPIAGEVRQSSFVRARFKDPSNSSIQPSNLKLATTSKVFKNFNLVFKGIKPTNVPPTTGNKTNQETPKLPFKLKKSDYVPHVNPITNRKHRLFFKEDLDRALFLLFKSNNKNRDIMDFLKQHVKDVNGNPLSEEAIINLAKVTMNEINKISETEQNEDVIIPGLSIQPITEEPIVNKLEPVQNTVDINKQPYYIKNGIVNKEDINSESFKALQNFLIGKGYKFETVNTIPNTLKPGVIYIIKDTEQLTYMGATPNKIDANLTNIGINTNTLWAVFANLHDKNPNTSTPTAEELLIEEIKQLQYSIDQLETMIDERIEYLVNNDATEEDANVIAYNEIFRKSDGKLNDDGNAYEKLRREIAQKKAELKQLQQTTQPNINQQSTTSTQSQTPSQTSTTEQQKAEIESSWKNKLVDLLIEKYRQRVASEGRGENKNVIAIFESWRNADLTPTIIHNILNSIYANIRTAEYNDRNDNEIEKYTGKVSKLLKRVQDENGWHYRIPKTASTSGKGQNRISLNVTGSKALIDILDKIASDYGIYYKTPSDPNGWSTRHDPVTIYINNENLTEVQIEELKNRVVRETSNFIRSNEGFGIYGENISKGVEFGQEASEKTAQDFINRAGKINTDIAEGIKNYLTRRGSKQVKGSVGQQLAVAELLKLIENTQTSTEQQPVENTTTTEQQPTPEANLILKDVESTAKALEKINTDHIEWVSKKEEETKVKEVQLKDGEVITLQYLLDRTPDNTVAYILGLDKEGNQISTVMIEKGKDGRWRGNDLEVDKEYRRKGLATTMYDYADELGHNLIPTKSLQPDGVKFWKNRDKKRNKFVAEAYHKAKSKPENEQTSQDKELIKAVEELILQQSPAQTTTPEAQQNVKVEEEVAVPITPYYPKNKTELSKVLHSLFGYSKALSNLYANLFDMWAAQQAIEQQTTKEEQYKIGFGNKELFDSLFKNAQESIDNILFNTKEFPTLDKEIEESMKKHKYDASKTNLPEKLWYLTKTPSFNKWFGKSVVRDENGDPLVQWHWSPNDKIRAFNLAGIGTHVGTQQAAAERRDTILKNNNNIKGLFYPMFVKLENPLEILDIGQHTLGQYISTIKEGFEAVGINLTEEDLRPFNYTMLNLNGEYTNLIKQLLNKYGFDGFTYLNANEDIGERSYIVVDKPQLKLVSAKAFDQNNDFIDGGNNKQVKIEDLRKCSL